MTAPVPAQLLQAVLFDPDDTLTCTAYREAAGWAAREFGLDATGVERALAAQWATHSGTLHTLDVVLNLVGSGGA